MRESGDATLRESAVDAQKPLEYVDAARVALEAAKQGLDDTGALLQVAGMKLVESGNALNSARGTDTLVSER